MTQQQARDAFYDALLDDDPVVLYERAPVGYLSTAPDGTIVKVNQTFLTWTGYADDDLVGRRRFVQLLSAGGRLYHETHYAPLLRMQRQVREIALDIVRADGTRLPVLVNSVLECDQAGAPRIIRVAVFDATERREYERELLRARHRAEESEQRARHLAQTLQATLLPPTPPVIPGLELASAFRPAGQGAEVGGDFYDVFQIAPDDWVVVIGDVCGKGVEAAIVTALVRHTVRAVMVALQSPSQTLGVLNEVLLDHEAGRFCTLALGRFRRVDGSWAATLGSAGHPPVLVMRHDRPADWHTARGPLVGVLPDATYQDHQLHLDAGDQLLFYTDGVTEAGRAGRMYGEERLRTWLDHHRGAADSMVTGLLTAVVEFQDDDPRDDIAILAVGVPADA